MTSPHQIGDEHGSDVAVGSGHQHAHVILQVLALAPQDGGGGQPPRPSSVYRVERGTASARRRSLACAGCRISRCAGEQGAVEILDGWLTAGKTSGSSGVCEQKSGRQQYSVRLVRLLAAASASTWAVGAGTGDTRRPNRRAAICSSRTTAKVVRPTHGLWVQPFQRHDQAKPAGQVDGDPEDPIRIGRAAQLYQHLLLVKGQNGGARLRQDQVKGYS